MISDPLLFTNTYIFDVKRHLEKIKAITAEYLLPVEETVFIGLLYSLTNGVNGQFSLPLFFSAQDKVDKALSEIELLWATDEELALPVMNERMSVISNAFYREVMVLGKDLSNITSSLSLLIDHIDEIHSVYLRGGNLHVRIIANTRTAGHIPYQRRFHRNDHRDHTV